MKLLLFLILIINFCNCQNKRDSADKIKIIIDLIKSGSFNKADSIHKTLQNDNVIDFDYRLLDLIIKLKQNQFDESLNKSKEFVRQYPNTCFGYYYAGLNEYNLANYKSSLAFFKEGLANIGESKNGIIYFPANQEKYSNSFVESSIYNDLIYMLGLNMSSVGEFRSSNSYLEDCLSREYKESKCYMIMGFNYEKIGDFTSAKKSYLLAKKFGNTDADAFLKKP